MVPSSDMRGTGILQHDISKVRQAFLDTQRLFDISDILRTAKSQTELLSLWSAYAESTTGDMRTELQDVYSEMLRKFGVLHP